MLRNDRSQDFTGAGAGANRGRGLDPSITIINMWRAPTSSAKIHVLPFRLKSFAKPEMASQNRHKKLRWVVW